MMKRISTLVLFVSAAVLTIKAQKTTYATRPVGVGQVLPQYLAGGNRFGENSTAIDPPTSTDSTTLQDVQLLHIIALWPVDKLPFWYVNSGFIKDQREQVVPGLIKVPSKVTDLPNQNQNKNSPNQ